MIPTIEQIVEDLIAGVVTARQAIGWLHQHAELASNELRDMFACAALQGLLANSFNDGVNQPLSLTSFAKTAELAYKQADEMLKRRDMRLAGDGERTS